MAWGSAPVLAGLALAGVQHVGAGVERGLLYLLPGACLVLIWNLLAARPSRVPPRLASAITAGAILVGLAVYPIPSRVGVALYTALAALAWDPFWSWLAGERWREPLAWGFGALASTSLAISIWPLLPAPPTEGVPGLHYPVSELDGLSDPRLVRAPGEPALEFAQRANTALHEGLANRDPWVTPGESWLVWLASRSEWGRGLNNVRSPRMILRRGGGYCHQRAIAFSEIAVANGLSAYAFGVSGHVVALLEHDGRTLLFDPDYGVGGVPYPGASAAALKQELKERYRLRLTRDSPPDDAAKLAERVAELIASQDDNSRVNTPGNRQAAATQEALLAAQTLGSLALLLWAGCVVLGPRLRTASDRLRA